jgi:hypothetical protein
LLLFDIDRGAGSPATQGRAKVKSLIRKKAAAGKAVAQCCAKVGKVVYGCHD